jgi:hypothetical protein
VVEGGQSRAQALRNYGRFSRRHNWKFAAMLRAQQLVPRLSPRGQWAVIRTVGRQRLLDWSFGHYLRIAPPEFAGHTVPLAAPAGRTAEPAAA